MPGLEKRGKLKIFLGYAAGTGKTYQMLEEAQALQRKGHDVAVGYFEPHGRKDTIAKTEGLKLIPRRVVEYRGAQFEELDVDAVLARHPEICVVDEFPHTNVPGSPRTKRWEDVQVFLDNGIHVFTTMNVQHLESLNDQVWHITGVRVRETIPDWVVQQAAEIVMVDVTPRALLHRLERGVVYSPEKARKALDNFFQESTLVALRELALRETAHEVGTRKDDRLQQVQAPVSADNQQERILIYVTEDPSSAALIRRGKRVADYLQAPCFAVAVSKDADLHSLQPGARDAIERHLNFARNLHVEAQTLQGESVADTLLNFARMHRITHLFLCRPKPNVWNQVFGKALVQEMVQKASDMQVTVVAERGRTNRRSQPPDG